LVLSAPPQPDVAVISPADLQRTAFQTPSDPDRSPSARDSSPDPSPAVAVSIQPEPSAKQAAVSPMARMQAIHRQAVERLAKMNSYRMRMRRREVVNGRKRPEEIILFQFRKEPYSVYFKWLGTEGKNREVIYVKGRYENLIHTRVAAGDIPLVSAGKRIKLAPDSLLVKSNSRHSITDAGLGHQVSEFGALIDAVARGDTRLGTVRYLGKLKRPEFEKEVEGVLQAIPPKSDPALPKGGQRQWFFDADHMPVLVITQDDNGQEVEFYCHDYIQAVDFDDDDFNPDKRWGK
jgi:hypothetical protein